MLLSTVPHSPLWGHLTELCFARYLLRNSIGVTSSANFIYRGCQVVSWEPSLFLPGSENENIAQDYLRLDGVSEMY
jgi:hypothetical protein